ncbi:class I SAM-dependent methyltransferase, partial [Symbiobacterium terraclitae]|uniref:class I SAM-dependent methyltransferase n=1 Tax=Symbiobacterium terraclitae TaxID=557451 RepID=UPI0035B5494D
MPRTPEESRALFDHWARTYDLSLAGSDGPKAGPLAGYRASLLAAADRVPVAPGAAVLDVGIGTGALAEVLAARGAALFGVDPSAEMLAVCGERHPAFTLEVGDFNQIPFAAARFDAVVSSFAFHEVPPAGRAAACAELARVLRPGGTLCLLDVMFASPASREEARAAIGEYWDDEEDYPLVGDLDALLYAAGLGATSWWQTAPFHWMVLAR